MRLLIVASPILLLLSSCEREQADTLPPAEVRALDLDGREVFPLQGGSSRFVALVFTRTDCPISNRYAPEVRRLHDRFTPLGVEFFLVYADPTEPVAKIREHVEAFGYPFRPLRDVGQKLVRLTGVKVTPEVALLDREGRLLYRGRIDDRFPDFGKARIEPDRRDFRDALMAVTAGAPVPNPRTEAVGCFIPDRATQGNEG